MSGDVAEAPSHAAFRDWCLGHAGCVGGDFGHPQAPAVWVCGIEPGGPRAVDAEALAQRVRIEGRARSAAGYASWRSNMEGSLHRRIVKLLAAVHGWPVVHWREFACQRQPFVRGVAGFARLNLYPVGFADTQPARWTADFARLTGFARKADYLTWCDAHRLPVLRRWAARHRPHLIVALGKSYAASHRRAFLDPDSALVDEPLAGLQLSWGRNAEGCLVAILPFLTSASGLQSNAAIEVFGQRLRQLVAQTQLPRKAVARRL